MADKLVLSAGICDGALDGVFAWIIVNRTPVGITAKSDGPFNYFCFFGCYLLPLAVL